MKLKDSIVQSARALYDDRLPYHNFKHIETTLEQAQLLVDECVSAGVKVDDQVVGYALLFHDAGYHENHTELGYSYKEDYSAKLASDILIKEGFEPGFIAQVLKAIDATKVDVRVTDEAPIEVRIVVRADLSGMAFSYTEFRDNSLKLKQEHEMIHGNVIELTQWKKMMKDIARAYLDQDFSISRPGNGSVQFYERARENFTQFGDDSELAQLQTRERAS